MTTQYVGMWYGYVLTGGQGSPMGADLIVMEMKWNDGV